VKFRFLQHCKNCISRLGRSEEGNVALLVAASVVVLCGFSALVSDLGVLYAERQHIADSADAGALAGADDLLKGASVAADTAYQYAAQNDPGATFKTVADSDKKTVTVTGERTLQLWFARVLGTSHATVHNQSTAALGTLVAATGMVPIAVPQQEFQYGQEVYLSDGAGEDTSGNFGYLDFSGNGANGVEQDIEQGYDFPLHVGELVSTETGDMAGPVQTAIQYRLDEDTGDSGCDSYDTAKADCPRVMYLPIVNTLDVSGKKDVTIVGFASFYLEGLDNTGGHARIIGRFIRMIRSGTIGSGQDFGTYSVKLTHS